jgi:UDP-N-acetyl-D-glucosamine dehydrogenase
MNSLIEKLHNRTAVVGVVGLGYVGLPLALWLSEVGYRGLGFDTDPQKAELLHDGPSYNRHVPDTLIQLALGNGFRVTSDYFRAAEVDALILCLPTPLNESR